MYNKWKNRGKCWVSCGGSGQYQVKKEEKQPLVLSCPKLRSLLISHLEVSASASDYQHLDRHWHRHCENFIFAIQFFKIVFEKKKKLFFLVLSYFALPSLCYKYVFFYDFLFVQSRPLLVQKKGCLNFRKHPPISVSKILETFQ